MSIKPNLNLDQKSSAINILVVDDHPIIRQSLIDMLTAQGAPFHVQGSAKTPEEALALIDKNAPPDVVLTDLHMPSMSGFVLIESLRRSFPAIRCLVFTASYEEEYMLQAFDLGAHGYLVKDAEAADLLRAIDVVSRGYTHFPSELSRALEQRMHKPTLTSREYEVLMLIAEGMTSKEIARVLGIDHRTVETYRSKIRQRFSLESSAALLRFAIENKKRAK